LDEIFERIIDLYNYILSLLDSNDLNIIARTTNYDDINNSHATTNDSHTATNDLNGEFFNYVRALCRILS